METYFGKKGHNKWQAIVPKNEPTEIAVYSNVEVVLKSPSHPQFQAN